MEIKNNFIEEILSVAWPRLRTKLITPKDPHCIDVLVEVANELYGVEVAYELHKNLSNGVYVAENNPLNYKKLKEDFWVKNKKSGNVYTVKNQNPEIHTEPSKDEIEAAKKDKSANTDNTQSSEPTSFIGAAAGFGNRVLTKVKNWTRQEKEYFQKGYHKPGSEQRRSIATAFKDKLKGAWKAVKDGLKHEVHTFKTAAVGVSKWMSGAPLTSEETKAIKTVVKHVAVTALVAFAGGGLAHGAAVFAKHVAIELVPHVVAETILVGVGRAAVFADADSEAETDLNFQKFGEMVADGLENMEISPEQMEAMVDSYEEKKKSGEIKIEPDTDQTPPTKETPKAKPEEEEDPLEKDLDSVKLGMMTGAEKDAYFKKKREQSDRLGEDIWIQNKDSHNFYQVDKFNLENHEPPTADELEMLKTPGKQSQKPPTKSKQTQKIADNLKGRKDSDGNTLDAETTNNGSLILGVEHGEGTESTQQSIKQIQSLPKDTKVMFVGEGGMTRDDNGNLELAGEQSEFRDATREHFSNWEESSWDENANIYDGDSPVYDFVAQSLGGSKSKAFAAIWSNMVGQGDDMDADDYLDDEGKEWLINQAKKGGSKEFDGDVDWNNLTDEQRGDLYELNFRDDNRLGETEISKSQEAYNNFRQKELDRKIKEAEDEGYTVIAPVGNSHVDLWRQRNKPKTESILRKIGISNWEFTQLLKEFSLISEADDIDIQSVLDSKVLNPDTNRQIKVSTGLGYDKASGGYQAAKAKMADSGISDEETEKAEKEKTDDDEEDETLVPEKEEKENPNKKNGHEGEEIREISDDELNTILEKYVNNEGSTPDNMRPIADKYADQDMDEGYSDDDFYSEEHQAALQKQKIKIRKNPYKVNSSTRKQLKKAGFPEKYIKFLERCINTQVNGKKPSVTELIKQGGAGQIQSQFGEVMAMAFMSIKDPAMRRKFADIINSEIEKSAEEFGGGKKASSIATRDWVESSLTHAEAFDSAMDEKYGKGQWRFEGAAWDIKGDIEALGLDYKNKGFSTDVMLRVQPLKDGKPYGPARAQKNSLKKDENIFFFNGSINEVNNFVLNYLDEGERKKVRGFEAIASKASPSNKNVEERNAAIAEAEKITGLKGTKAIKALKEKALGLRDKALNAAPKEVQDAVSKVRNFGPAQTASAQNLIKTANTTIKNPNNVIDNAKNIDSAEKDFAKFAYKAVKDCQAKGGDLTLCIRQKLSAAGENTTDDRVCKVAVMATKVGVAAGDLKSKEALEKHYNLGVEAGNILMEIITESEQLMGGLMQKLADAFPLKTCMDGEEFMGIDGMKVTQKTLQTVFGVNSYDELQKGMKLRRLPNGEIILVYGAKDKNGQDIPIGVVGTRQKGKGYEGTVGFEISCSDDFALAIAEANTKNGDTSTSNEKARQSIGKRVGKRKK